MVLGDCEALSVKLPCADRLQTLLQMASKWTTAVESALVSILDTFAFVYYVVDALFVITNFGGTMNNVSPTFAIPDHLQYCICRQIGPVCNVVDLGTWWSSSASAAWDTACDDVLF